MSRSKHLVLVPGLTCTRDIYGPQIIGLSGHTAVHVADHTGHDTIEGLAASILARAPPSFALCGLSMGGYIAFEMLRQAPRRIERVALLDTAAGPEVPGQRVRRLRLMEMAETGKYQELSDILWPLFVHPARYDDAALKATVFKMIADTGPTVFLRQQTALLNRPDSRAALAEISCPALVLVGAQDRMTPPAESRAIASAIPGAELIEIPDCGHLSTLERPDAVNRALIDWLG